MKLKHFLLFVIITCGVIIAPHTVNAQCTAYRFYDSSYNLLRESGCTEQNINLQNVRYIRVITNDSYTANCQYNVNGTFNISKLNDYAWLYWSGSSGVNVGGRYVITSPSFASTLDQRVIGSSTYYKSSYLGFSFTSPLTSSSGFIQLDLQSASRILFFNMTGYTVNQTSCTSSTPSTDLSPIINNDNRNTTNIINNNNNNTQQIINSQNETTNAINDVNDTLQDTEIEGESIGGKLADIGEISDTPITDLITLPITLLQRIYNSINGSCSSYSLPFGFGLTNYTLNLPCIDLGHEKYLGRVVWGVIDDLFCIFMLFFLFKMIVWFYTNWSTLKDNFSYLVDPSNRGLF